MAARNPVYLAVVDDDPQVLDGLQLALESNGHEVAAETHGDGVLEKLRRDRRAPAAVVTDYRLDGETGVEVLEAGVD